MDFLLAIDNTLYQYDYERDAAVEVTGATAYTKEGLIARWDEENTECLCVKVGFEVAY